ncbi:MULTISPECIES: cell wall hydrolase [Brucella/Ochrobactrum group]|uniref:Cell wall hydrolase n=1 Tax=Brucella pseudintermedia TaxID=370111 RepID=A0ABY5UBK7_9HYPH|nr:MULTISPECIES: cell wall hydrolase [Brucella/Ochrobactrum group]MCO7727651.1 cell wall hydrolase [Brucella intermedia]KAB2682169.1 cell wall hydrolase [Brucella pseudintermedia]TWH02185.1 spore germination cell wall hydrolase CwlJ-like protein [Ochrobactrum sp. J50]UWL60112.1 cell wall hydrolase [Brucella pseudintermedia]WPM80533.1 cell wall hydrolase [Brucella pseudintermedia]
MRLVSIRALFGRRKAVAEPVWHYPVTGYCPEEGRYYAVRAKPRQTVQKPHRMVPLVLAAVTYLFNSNAIAFQDMASLVPSADMGTHRWTAFVAKAPVGSVHQAEMPFVDATTVTGSIATNGIEVPGIGRVALSGGRKTAKLGPDDPNPDENRINRSDKTGRLVSVKPKAPAKAFTAGSMFDKISMITRPPEKTDAKMAFSSKLEGKEIAITMAFHAVKPPKPRSEMPTQLAKLITNDQPDVLALGYAPATPDYGKTSPFESILKPQPDEGRFVPPIGEQDHEWAATPLPPSAFSKSEQKCLAEAVYFEARGETVKGQVAVAQVVLNRVRNPAYPGTICGVVYQNRDWLNACQFSFACDGQKHRVTEMPQWRMAQQVAKTVSAGQIWLPEVGSATHYHATYVRPFWAPTMKKVTKIGLHVFYRTYGGGWS